MKYKNIILFISSWYPTRLSAYPGDFVKRHAKAVTSYVNTICLHVIHDQKLKSNYERTIVNNDGITEVIYYYRNNSVFKILFHIYYYIQGFIFIKNSYGKPALIHGNILYPIGPIVYLLSGLFCIPYIFTEHWTGYHNGDYSKLRGWLRKMYNFIGRKAKYIMPVTKHLENSMKECRIAANFTVIPNVVETSIFKIGESWSDGKINVLHISNLKDAHKNVSGILRVVSKLSNKRNDFVLNIIHSNDNDDLVKYSKELGVYNSYVRFCGQKSYEEVAQFMMNASFLLLFSNYENFPCVIVEAMASGLPILSSDVGGICEHIDDSKGILINKKDENALFDKLNYMLDNYHNYNKHLLREYAISHFSYEQVGRDYFEIYKEILNA